MCFTKQKEGNKLNVDTQEEVVSILRHHHEVLSSEDDEHR